MAFPTYDIPAPRDNYKHHYGLKSKKGVHSFNDMYQVPDYIPPHYMDYKHHYGTHEKKGRHSFGAGDLSDFGGFRSNEMDAHSYLYGPNEYQAPVYPVYDAHDYLGHDYIHPAPVHYIPDAINV